MSGLLSSCKAASARTPYRTTAKTRNRPAKSNLVPTKQRCRTYCKSTKPQKNTSIRLASCKEKSDWTLYGTEKSFTGHVAGNKISGKSAAGTDATADGLAQVSIKGKKTNYIAEGRGGSFEALDSVALKAQREYGQLALAPKVDFLKSCLEFDVETSIPNRFKLTKNLDLSALLKKVAETLPLHEMKDKAWSTCGGGTGLLALAEQRGPDTNLSLTIGRRDGTFLCNTRDVIRIGVQLKDSGMWEVELQSNHLNDIVILFPGGPLKSVYNGSKAQALTIHSRDREHIARFLDQVTTGDVSLASIMENPSFSVGAKQKQSREFEAGIRIPFGSAIECAWVGRLPLVLKMKNASRGLEILPGRQGQIHTWKKFDDLTYEYQVKKNTVGEIEDVTVNISADLTDNPWIRLMWGEFGCVERKLKRLQALEEVCGSLPEEILKLKTGKNYGLSVEGVIHIDPQDIKFDKVPADVLQSDLEDCIEKLKEQKSYARSGVFFRRDEKVTDIDLAFFEDAGDSETRHIKFWTRNETTVRRVASDLEPETSTM